MLLINWWFNLQLCYFCWITGMILFVALRRNGYSIFVDENVCIASGVVVADGFLRFATMISRNSFWLHTASQPFRVYVSKQCLKVIRRNLKWTNNAVWKVVSLLIRWIVSCSTALQEWIALQCALWTYCRYSWWEECLDVLLDSIKPT